MTQTLTTKVLIIGWGGKMRWAALALCLVFAASPALACTTIVAVPRPGETFEQAEIRDATARQQDSWARADGVFLVRVTDNLEEPYISRGLVIAAIKGSSPPGSIEVLNGCRAPQPGVVVVVFAERRGRQWTTFDNVYPAEVRDPRLLAELRGTASRLN